MIKNKSNRFITVILLIELMSIVSGCVAPTTPNGTTEDGEEVILKTTYKVIDLNEGIFSIESMFYELSRI